MAIRIRSDNLSSSKWSNRCAATVTDAEGGGTAWTCRRATRTTSRILDVVEAKSERQVGLPEPTLATVFEVVTGGKVYRVTGAALQRWIVQNRSSLNGLKGCCPGRGRGWSSNFVWLQCLSVEVSPSSRCQSRPALFTVGVYSGCSAVGMAKHQNKLLSRDWCRY
jgi:hypothetical protein